MRFSNIALFKSLNKGPLPGFEALAVATNLLISFVVSDEGGGNNSAADESAPDDLVQIYIRKSGAVYYMKHNPPFMGPENPVTGRCYQKAWHELQPQQKIRRAAQFDNAVHSNAYPHVTYQFRPHPNQSANTAQGMSPLLQQLTQIAVTNTQRLDNQERDTQLVVHTTGDLAEQVKSIAEQVRCNDQNNRTTTEAVEATRKAQVAQGDLLQTVAKRTQESFDEHANLLSEHAREIMSLTVQFKDLKGEVGEMAITLNAVTNKTIIYKENICNIYDSLHKIRDWIQTPAGKARDEKAKALTIDTGDLDLTTPETSPAGQPTTNTFFTFDIEGAVPSPNGSPWDAKPPAVVTSSHFPPELNQVFSIGFEPRKYEYDFEGPLTACFDACSKAHPNRKFWLVKLGSDFLCSQPESLPFGIDVPDDQMVPTLCVVVSEYEPTRYGCLEWMENGITLKDITSFKVLGLKWVEVKILGRSVNVLVNSGAPINEDTKKKLTLLLNSENFVKKSLKAPKADQGTVQYRKVLRNDAGEIQKDPESDEVMYNGELQHLTFSTGEIEDDLDDYEKQKVLDPVDRDAVRLMAEMDIALNKSPMFKLQNANRKATMDKMCQEIAEDNGVLKGNVAKALNEMVIAKVYPSRENFDYVQDGGVTMNAILGGVECNANEFYPENTTPPVNQFESWQPVGYGLKGQDANDADDAK